MLFTEASAAPAQAVRWHGHPEGLRPGLLDPELQGGEDPDRLGDGEFDPQQPGHLPHLQDDDLRGEGGGVGVGQAGWVACRDGRDDLPVVHAPTP